MAALLLALAAAADVADLSAPLERSADYNSNPAQTALRAAEEYGSALLAYTVLKGGKVVAEHTYYPEYGLNWNTEYWMWSVTKSVSSMLIGQLVDRGSVNTTSTLEEIFGDEVKWDEVIEGESKKLITLEELLTMTSGLADPDELMDYDESNDPPQESLLDVLNHGEFKDGNEFAYLSSTHILAYVIRSASGGETPAAFATGSSGAFTALGIDKFTWTADAWHTTTNADGMQGSGYGLQMKVRDMAKIGQLYLQEGMSAPSTQLLSAEYVAASTEMKVGPWPNWRGVNWMADVSRATALPPAATLRGRV